MGIFYLATEPGGHLFYADGPARVGTVLSAVVPEDPFPDRGLLAAETPADALRSPHITWPCDLWRVEGEPDEKRSEGYGGTLSYFESLRVLSADDPELVFGPNSSEVLSLFAGLRGLRANDLFLVTTVDEEFYATHDYADDEESPCYLALKAAHKLAEGSGLKRAQEVAASRAQRLAKHAAEQLFDAKFMPERHDEPYGKMKTDLHNAAYCAASALVVSDQLSQEQLTLLISDVLRITGFMALPSFEL